MARTIGHNYRENVGYKDIKKAAANRRILPLEAEIDAWDGYTPFERTMCADEDSIAGYEAWADKGDS